MQIKMQRSSKLIKEQIENALKCTLYVGGMQIVAKGQMTTSYVFLK